MESNNNENPLPTTIDHSGLHLAKNSIKLPTEGDPDGIQATSNVHYNQQVKYAPSAPYQNNSFTGAQPGCTRKVRFFSPHMRMRPYYVPHRTRTKSESSDTTTFGSQPTLAAEGGSGTYANPSSSLTLMETGEPAVVPLDIPMCGVAVSSTAAMNLARCKYPVVMLKKYRSLEDVRVDKSVEGSQPSHEMEFVSSRIQKLKVHE
ncbi:uncharacterized protein LOC126575125 [Anopheles aquasalis]|uniref:uncharacterized protein LOC126575125 n=1 Tax=Anopheles aquasalis TaxID=42839 RepID=UPI00215A7353|nr:uncharacterized protein LOC126575125 [Anopheles aquasalis]